MENKKNFSVWLALSASQNCRLAPCLSNMHSKIVGFFSSILPKAAQRYFAFCFIEKHRYRDPPLVFLLFTPASKELFLLPREQKTACSYDGKILKKC